MRGAKILTPRRQGISSTGNRRRRTNVAFATDSAFVPAGQLKIARQFIAGLEYKTELRPEGTLEIASYESALKRPPGTLQPVAELAGETHDDGPAWIHADAKPGTQTSPDVDVEEKLKEAFARGWSVIVWNDPVNLMDYVVYVFKTVLKMNEKDASRHMWEVHQNGKSMVARETRERSELIVHRLRSFGLNATLEQE
jgi:ATP-dependent Clp protease adaptor protein ClpS